LTPSDAERFAVAYAAIRQGEQWAERDRARRATAVARTVDSMRAELGANATIASVGAGAMRVPGVIAVDLLAPANVRADMRALPFADGAIDGAVYAASLHYAELGESVPEAARVLRGGGLLAVIDSPIYFGQPDATAAAARSAAYYARAGHPELAAFYHPLEAGALRATLAQNRFEMVELTAGSRWRRLLRRGPRSFVLARKLR